MERHTTKMECELQRILWKYKNVFIHILQGTYLP